MSARLSNEGLRCIQCGAWLSTMVASSREETLMDTSCVEGVDVGVGVGFGIWEWRVVIKVRAGVW